jgi:hypothetical protein
MADTPPTLPTDPETRRRDYMATCSARNRHRLIRCSAVSDAREEAFARLRSVCDSPREATLSLNHAGPYNFYALRWIIRTPKRVLREWVADHVPRFVVMLDPADPACGWLSDESALLNWRDESGRALTPSAAKHYTRRGTERVVERVRRRYPNAVAVRLADATACA